MNRTVTPDRVGLGIVLMLLGIGLLSAMDAVAKWIVEGGMNPIQILALRSLVIVPVLLIGFAARGQLDALMPTRHRWQAVRSMAGFLAPFCYFLSLRYLPLSDAVVVFFSSTFMSTGLSVWMLKERVGVHRWAAVIIGYVGVVIAMVPQGEGQLQGYLLVLVASLSYAFLFVTGRMLSATESVSSLVFSFNLGVGLVALLMLPWFWVAMGWWETALVLLLSALAVAGHFSLTAAFSAAPVSAIAPFEYTALLWAVGLDYFVWRQLPLTTTWAGAAIIIASGLYLLYRERLHKSASPHPPSV
jgi:drug/metabolite transporter (DMT)-like permease